MDEPELPPHATHTQHLLAGAVAGISEHLVMFPVDTVKTRLQTMSPGGPAYKGMLDAFQSIVRTEGPLRLWRGLPAVFTAAIPSHGLYFAVYEAAKQWLGAGNNTPLKTGLAGACAVAAHDAVVTPLDVVKQRLQLYRSAHTGVFKAMRSLYAEHGARLFFLSYPTTLAMNCPYAATNFIVYEACKHHLAEHYPKHPHAAWHHLLSGMLAGVCAAAVSNPLDVVKTRLQVQGEAGRPKLAGFQEAFRSVYAEGPRTFFRGVSPRMTYAASSLGLCWTTYEYMKKLMGLEVD
eukprot:gnl/Hemi2/425_TR146_c0_g1_i1.p1 gnl/Hemi2/425_TR146_c0_g1~~gnl/Hemi2/425_TR146_c0_g1_i1.p1  ORF type:complete len:291 (+),score=72.12 gnl/Hemi2/425_TR146_c0_g1_i1:147-1019(+)